MTPPDPSETATNRALRWTGISTAASARAGILIAFGLGLALAAANAGQGLMALGSCGTLVLAVALAWSTVALAAWIGMRRNPFPALPFIGITLAAVKLAEESK